MVQKLFSIYTHPDESNHLHVEVGKNHIACWCTADETAFTALEYFNFTYDNTEGAFVDVFRELKRGSILLSNTFASEEIVWENANFMCVPASFFKEDAAESYLCLVNSHSFQSPPMHEPLHDFVLTFSADSVFYKIVTENLPKALHTHKFCQLLRQQIAAGANTIHLLFYPTYFLITAIKNGVLQLAAIYYFKTPQEAVYHILNIKDKLEMPADETVTTLSGFIDENSSLYKEIYQYVNNLRFAQEGKLKEEHPAHYFTSYNLPTA